MCHNLLRVSQVSLEGSHLPSDRTAGSAPILQPDKGEPLAQCFRFPVVQLKLFCSLVFFVVVKRLSRKKTFRRAPAGRVSPSSSNRVPNPCVMTSVGCEDATRAVRPPQTPRSRKRAKITATLQREMGSVTYFGVLSTTSKRTVWFRVW